MTRSPPRAKTAARCSTTRTATKIRVTNSAGAQAAAIINEAESARNRYVESLQPRPRRFSDLLPKYESNPSLFAQQKLVQVMGEVLTNVQDKIYLPTARRWQTARTSANVEPRAAGAENRRRESVK